MGIYELSGGCSQMLRGGGGNYPLVVMLTIHMLFLLFIHITGTSWGEAL